MPVLILVWSLLFDLGARVATAALPGARATPPHICDQPGLDLDDDGALDGFETTPDSCGTGGCRYTVSRAAAPGALLGTIDGCWFSRGAVRHHGLFDVVAVWRLGVDTETTVYRFDGHQYRPR
ncbi:MAG: hypothetical protein IT370_08950 [Deltaproteobacteria bacterium]|nr:hypothetical protein [Deltaproteobacteria bacterium]